MLLLHVLTTLDLELVTQLGKIGVPGHARSSSAGPVPTRRVRRRTRPTIGAIRVHHSLFVLGVVVKAATMVIAAFALIRKMGAVAARRRVRISQERLAA